MDLERNAMVASKVSNFPQFLIRAKKSFLMWGRVFCTAKQGIQHQLEELYTTSINLKIVHFRELELEISFHHSRCFYSRELLFCAPAAATSARLKDGSLWTILCICTLSSNPMGKLERRKMPHIFPWRELLLFTPYTIPL